MDFRGHLHLLLLATLARTGPAHGYAIIAALREHSAGAFDLPEGTVYPVLRTLETAGLLRSEWDTSTPRRRRVYTLTTAGQQARVAQRRQWYSFAQAVGSVVGRHVQAVGA